MEKEESLQTPVLELLQKMDTQIEEQNTVLFGLLQSRDSMIDRLHDELDYYKKDAANRFENQLLKAVIKVRKDMKKTVLDDSFDSLDADTLRRLFTYAFEDLTDLLEQQNCDEIESQPGAAFDPAIHLAKVEATDDPALDKTVKVSLSTGFKKDNKVLIPERVIVYQLRKEM